MNVKNGAIIFIKSLAMILVPFSLTFILYRHYTGSISNLFNFFYSGLIYGDWGTSWERGEPVERMIAIKLGYYISELLAIFILTTILIILFVQIYIRTSRKNDIPQIFRGNWLTLLLGPLIIITIFLFRGQPLIYDNYRSTGYFASLSYFANVIFTSLIFVSAILYQLSILPSYRTEIIPSDVEYPHPSTKYFNSDQKISFSDNWMFFFSEATKRSVPHLLGYHILISYFLNSPDLGRDIFNSYFNRDPPYLIFNFLLILVIHGILYLIVSLGSATFKDKQLQGDLIIRPDDSTTRNYIGTISLIFIIISFIASIGMYILLLTSPQIRSYLIISNPTYFNNNARNVGIFSNGYILGTDYLGRDILAMITLSLFTLIIPLILGLIFRGVIVLLYLLSHQKAPIIDKIIRWVANFPRVPLLLMITLSTLIYSPIVFYLILAIIFTPQSIIAANISNQSNRANISIKQKIRDASPVFYHIILSIIIELLIMGFASLPLRFDLNIVSLSRIIINQISNYPTSRPLQSIIVMLIPVLLILPWYFKMNNQLGHSTIK